MPASLAARGLGPQITVRSSSFAETYAIGLRSFVNEARLLARFDHPSLVKVYRFWEDNATAYMVMPFLQGTTLRDTRRRMAHPPDEAWIRSVITPILSALELLHREGVYHRDIAPDNILLPPDGPPVLLDFGAARRVISDRTQSLTAILKPSYAPIEQYAEMTQLRQGPWTDLYALGAVIHYLLFGAPPAPATARAVQDDADQIENRIVPGVSPRFLEAVSWMLSIRPNQRPQNGEQLRAVLDGNAAVPPRGRPGITIPPKLAGAAAPAAAYEPTRHVEPTADPTRLQTAHIPTYLPTAHVAPPGQARAATFSPTAQMPSPRAAQAPLDTHRGGAAGGGAAAADDGPPPSGGRPSEWPQSRPATLPPPLPARQPRARCRSRRRRRARARRRWLAAPRRPRRCPRPQRRRPAARKSGSSWSACSPSSSSARPRPGSTSTSAIRVRPKRPFLRRPRRPPVVVASPPAPVPQPSQPAATPDQAEQRAGDAAVCRAAGDGERGHLAGRNEGDTVRCRSGRRPASRTATARVDGTTRPASAAAPITSPPARTVPPRGRARRAARCRAATPTRRPTQALATRMPGLPILRRTATAMPRPAAAPARPPALREPSTPSRSGGGAGGAARCRPTTSRRRHAKPAASASSSPWRSAWTIAAKSRVIATARSARPPGEEARSRGPLGRAARAAGPISRRARRGTGAARASAARRRSAPAARSRECGRRA